MIGTKGEREREGHNASPTPGWGSGKPFQSRVLEKEQSQERTGEGEGAPERGRQDEMWRCESEAQVWWQETNLMKGTLNKHSPKTEQKRQNTKNKTEKTRPN